MYATSSVAINFLGQGCAGAKPLLAEDGLRGDPRLVLADWSRRLSVYGGPGWNLRRWRASLLAPPNDSGLGAAPPHDNDNARGRTRRA